MRVELIDPQGVLLAEIPDKRLKREDVALTYAMALRFSERDDLDWRQINEAIIERWSMAGLKWIKTRAWKVAQEGTDGRVSISIDLYEATLIYDALGRISLLRSRGASDE